MLPGGYLHNGKLERGYLFKPVTGYTEVIFSEIADRDLMLPDQVTEVLLACVEKIGVLPVNREILENLSVGDRQYLMRMISVYMGFDDLWLTSNCCNCAVPFDINIRQSEMPVKTAGKGYPFVFVKTDNFKIKLRVPTGADQRRIVEQCDDNNVAGSLVSFLMVEKDGEGKEDFLQGLSLELLGRIEKEVESVSPEVAGVANAGCPECGSENHVRIDPYICLKLIGKDIFSQIHKLASEYHWSEEQILSLPRSRRQVYLNLIEKNC